MEKNNYIKTSINAIFKSWLMRILLWGGILYLLLIFVDYFVTPENWKTFAIYRISAAVLLFILFFIAKILHEKKVIVHYVIAFAGIIIASVAAELMILGFGGHKSIYYTGMMLISMCATGFLPAGIQFHLLSNFCIISIYFFPIILSEPVVDVQHFVHANSNIAAVFITMGYLRYLTDRKLIVELGLKYDLERNRRVQDRLNPHFLYNAMHTIHALIHKAPEKADKAVSLLSGMFHYITDKGFKPLVTFADEWAFTGDYLKFQKIRFFDTLDFEAVIDGDFTGVLIPPLTIQPLVENSIKHGIRKMENAGKLFINARKDGNRVKIEISDDGAGLVKKNIFSGTLGIIKSRLEYYFSDSSFIIQNREESGTRVVIYYNVDSMISN